MTVKIPSDLYYRPDIDGLRAMAVLAVVLFHAWPKALPAGFVGVDMFFVISGYLITGKIWRSLEEGSFSLSEFYERRIRRIVPALLFMLAIVSGLSWALLIPDDVTDYGETLTGAALSFSNVIFGREVSYFHEAAYTKPLLHTWSLAVEEQFYAIFPIVLLVLHRYARRVAFVVILVLTIGSVSMCICLRHVEGAFYWSHLRAWELMLGSLAVWMRPSTLASRLVRDALIVCGLMAIFIANLCSGIGATASSILACLGTSLAIICLGTGPSAIKSVLEWRYLVRVGLISYSLYLWHWPLLALANYYTLGNVSVGMKIACIATAFAIAMISWQLVEQPIRKRLGAWPRPRFFVVSAVMVGMFAWSGHYLSTMNTLPPEAAVLKAGADELDALGFVPFIGTDQAEIRLGADLQPDTLLWGDSHASAVAMGVGLAAQRHHKSIRFLGMRGHLPLLEPGISITGKISSFVSNDKTIHTVILDARWQEYFSDPKYQSAEVHLQSTVDRLREMGKQVVIVYPIPQFAMDIPHQAAYMIVHGEDPSTLVLPAHDFDQHNALAVKILDSLQGELIRIKPHMLLRSGDVYISVKDGRSLYRDAHHLSFSGSTLVSPAFDVLFERSVGSDNSELQKPTP